MFPNIANCNYKSFVDQNPSPLDLEMKAVEEAAQIVGLVILAHSFFTIVWLILVFGCDPHLRSKERALFVKYPSLANYTDLPTSSKRNESAAN